jgi:SagB-type dehydrogenase family enzyme
MVRTRHANLEVSDQQRGVPAPSLFRYGIESGEEISLPQPDSPTDNAAFHTIAEQRSSVRAYSETPMSAGALSYLLHCTAGVHKLGKIHTIRTVPSAGARHAIDTAVYVNRIGDISPGLYGYAPEQHSLVPHFQEREVTVDRSAGSDSPIDIKAICKACFDQTFILEAAAVFIWIATPYRMNWRYGVRGYRYLHLDAGHICQNLYLAAESIGGGVCAIAAYDDEQLNTLMGLNGTDEFVIYLATTGMKKG